MPLTAQEQDEMDTLELKELEAKAAGSAPVAAPAQASPAQPNRSMWNSDIPVPGPAGVGSFMVNPAQVGQTVKNLGLEGGGATLGQTVGAPFEAVGGIHIGGAIGGFLGNTAAQLTTPGKKFSLGEAGAAGVAGMVPGASLAKAGAKTLLTQGAKYAGTNLVGKAVQTGIDEKRLPTLGEATMAAGTGFAGAPLGKYLDGGMRASAITKATSNNAPERRILEAGRKEGFVLGPNQLRTAPKMINTPMEAIANTQALNASTQIKNQIKVDDIARREAGLLPTDELSQKSLNTARIAPNQTYAEVAAVSPVAKETLESYKNAMNEASLARRAFRDQADTGKYNRELADAANAAEMAGDRLHKELTNEVARVGRKGLIDELQNARVRLAKISAIERNLNVNGRVSATGFSMDSSGGAKFTDGLETIANWARSFPKSVGDFPREANTQTIFQNPIKALGFTGVPLAARSVVQSAPYQRSLVSPFYGAATEDVPATIGRLGLAKAGRDAIEPDEPLTEQEIAELQKLLQASR